MVDKIFGGPMSSAWPRSPDSQQRKLKPRAEAGDENPSNDQDQKLAESVDKSPGLAEQETLSAVPASSPLPDTGATIHIDEYV